VTVAATTAGRPALRGSLLALGLAVVWPLAHLGPQLWWTVFLVPLLWWGVVDTLRAAPARQLALVSFGAATVAFLVIVGWLATPAGVVALVLLAVVQGLWLALASLVARPWAGHVAGPVVAALTWTAMEVLRARVPLGGFGWADLASAHTDASWMLSSVRIVGADGLTLLTALLGALVWDAGRRFVDAAGPAPQEPRPGLRDGGPPSPGAARVVGSIDAARPQTLGALGVAALGLLLTVGPPPAVGTLDVLLVQGNDGTRAASGAQEDLRIAGALRDATLASVAQDGAPELTVWPENALDRDPWTDRGADLLPVVQEAAAAVQGDLLVGVLRPGPDSDTFRNTVTVVDAQGLPGVAYDKQLPVPFGEYVPLRPLLGGLPPLAAQVPRDMVRGTGTAVLPVAGTTVGVMVCFETLFPEVAHDAVRAGAQVLVAATNDASFDSVDEAYQHLQQSRLRAVETGRAVVHAALSGSSAVVLPDGSVTQRTQLYDVTTVRAQVPLVDGTTPALAVAPVLRGVVLALAGVAAALGAVLARRRGTPGDGGSA